MNYETNERIKSLSERIKLFKEKRQIDRKNRVVMTADIDYRLGDLLAELISESQLQSTPPTIIDLENFHKKYIGNENIDLDFLYKKHWIRQVLNRIKIPYSIEKACQLISKGFPLEFQFIKFLNQFLVKSGKKYFTKNELITVLDDYNKDKPEGYLSEENLKDKGIYCSRGLSFDELELHSYAKYLLFVETYQSHFSFIDSFLGAFPVDGDSNYYSLDIKAVRKIISRHKKSYPKCPSIKELKTQGFFRNHKNAYLFKLSYGNHTDWWITLGNLIAGKLWTKLKSDSSYSSDEQRLDVWLDKIQNNADYPTLCLDYMSSELKEEFIKIIEKRILDEPDILGCEGEIEKLSLEQSYSSNGTYPLIDKIQLVFLGEQSAAEKYRLFTKLDRNNLFRNQSCRQRLDILLHILMRSSNGYENPSISFPSVFKLLESSKDKPYLVWQVAELITYIRPEIIPYLFSKTGLQELGVLLLPTFKLSQYCVQYGDRDELSLQGEELRTQINKEGLITLLNSISYESPETAAPVLARAIIESAKQIFYLPYNFDTIKQKTKQLQINAYIQIWEIISRFRIGKQQFVYQHGKDRPLFIFYLLNEFSNKIISYKSEEPFNEMYTPDIWRVDALIRLLNIIKNPALIQRELYQDTYQEKTIQLESKITNKISQIYQGYFTINEIDVRSSPLNELERKIINFRSKIYGLELLQWNIFIKSLNAGQRNTFFQNCFPQFDLAHSVNAEFNTFNLESENAIHRLRFHIKVILNTYFSLIDEDIIDKELTTEIEKHLTQTFYAYSKAFITTNSVDIFDKQYDAYSGENLFVRLIEATNTFSKTGRRKILDSLVKNDQFERILTALNILVSQGDKQHLLSALTSQKLKVFLNRQSFYFDVENALVHSINNKELVDYAEKILKYIENKKYRIKSNYEQQSLLYHVKLLLAYRKEDIKLLKSIEPPKDEYDRYSKNRQRDESRKKYYEILLLHNKDKYEEAIRQIDQLAFERKDDIIVLNLKFSLYNEKAKRKYKEDNEEGKKLIKLSLELFNESFKDCNLDLVTDSIERDILLNRLECLDLLEQNSNFDFYSSKVKTVDKYTEPFACLITENKIKRGQLTEASTFIEELINYHQKRSGEIPEFIESLRNNLSTHQEHVIYLKQAYKDILCLSEGKRIQALPDVITRNNKNFGLFLLGELTTAITSLQNKLYALVKNGDKVTDLEEDKITDVLELILNARLSAWQMQWHSQSRSGTTGDKTNQLARPDLTIKEANIKLIYEALRIYSYKSISSLKTYIVKHIEKTFNATSTIKISYNVIYYQASDFDNSWPKFKKIINEMIFPKRVKRVNKMEDIISESTSDLKIGFTKHENDVICYYLFINCNPAIM